MIKMRHNFGEKDKVENLELKKKRLLGLQKTEDTKRVTFR